MYHVSQIPISGERENLYDGHWIIDYIKSGSPADKAGLRIGDTIVSCNHYTLEEWFAKDHGQKVGDMLIFGILRNNIEVGYPVVITSYLSTNPGIYWSSYLFFILVSSVSLFILFKKPKEKAVKLYFIFIQCYCLSSIGGMYVSQDPLSMLIIWSFLFSATFQPAVLIHFHLVFPRPARYFSRFGKLPFLFYGIAIIFYLFQVICIAYQLKFGSFNIPFLDHFLEIGLLWTAGASLIAIALAIYQFVTIKETLARNQLRIIVIGTVIGSAFSIFFAVFYDYVMGLCWTIYPNLIQFATKASGLAITTCLLIAIFKYRIWEMEIVLKKVLLYLLATAIIILSYLALLYLVDLFTLEQTKTVRFISLAGSVLIFLILRDRMQRLTERIFHRENYDSAAVVAEFEEKMAGAFRIEDLGSRILDGIDDIFHFRFCTLGLRKDKMLYQPAFVHGNLEHNHVNDIELSHEFETMLQKSKIFSPGELQEKYPVFEDMHGELIVPLVKDDKPFGFLVCGPKKSEKVYSMQDIRVLSLIAKRVVALFHTAELYQKDLDRQLMLERERARIAQDMHDDIGAGLTKIAMISEAAFSGESVHRSAVGGGKREAGNQDRERLFKITSSAREMINRLNVIVWALNPRYDNLESLISYARRYFGEYLENFDIGFRMEVPDEIPDIQVTPDFRRNAFYAWQEAVHNAVKHGQCTEIRFDVGFIHQRLQVAITDNGKGYDQAKPGSGGNGLLNMKKRAEEMGGRFDIQSSPDRGTRVVFDIHLQ